MMDPTEGRKSFSLKTYSRLNRRSPDALLFESTLDPNKLVFVEEWESPECLPLHSKSDHMKTFGRVAVKCFAAPVQVQIITPEKVEKR